ncbi:MAG: complex I subunit 5 family protein [Halodesulfurarchaeum sp.]
MAVHHIVVAPLVIALLTAIVTLLSRTRPIVQQGGSVLGVLTYAVSVVVLLFRVYPDTILTYQLGGWPAPFGITLVADSLSVFMLGLTAVLAVPSLIFSLRYVDEFGQRVSYHSLFHFMLVGMTGSFLTGDIFNMFVWFEVMLMASYVLVVFFSGKAQTRAALRYVILNLIGSSVMLLAIGGIYATTGTLNMADLARRLNNPAAYGFDPAPVLGLSALLFAVFALKAGLVPFQFWVPSAYRAAPAPVTAMLAGAVKKVGVYAIIRLYFGIFATASLPVSLPGIGGRSVLAFFGPVLFVMATASIVFGGTGAIARDDIEGLLAYSSIGQVGFIVLPLAIAATIPSLRSLAIAATLVYALNHALAKGMLFLVAGTIRSAAGTTDFHEISGLANVAPGVTGAFFVGGLALVGIPPLSGFFAKLLVFETALGARTALPLGIALFGAILTIAYVSRAWNRGFWGDTSGAVANVEIDRVQIALVLALAIGIVAVGVGFDVILDLARAASDAALSRSAYIDAVDLTSLEAVIGGGQA